MPSVHCSPVIFPNPTTCFPKRLTIWWRCSGFVIIWRSCTPPPRVHIAYEREAYVSDNDEVRVIAEGFHERRRGIHPTVSARPAPAERRFGPVGTVASRYTPVIRRATRTI